MGRSERSVAADDRNDAGVSATEAAMSDGAKVIRLPQRGGPPPDTFRPFYASQMEGVEVPPPEWIVDGVLMRGTVSLFAGPPGIGKSMLIQQLLTATALGQPWLNKETVQARSFGLFCEDPDHALRRRQAAVNAYYDRDACDLEVELSWESRVGKDATLIEFERWGAKPKFTALWDQLWNFVEEDSVQVVALDTAAAVFGGSEIARDQVTRFMRELERRAIAMNGAVILSVHPSSGKAYSGSTAWLASVRSGITIGRPPEFDPETGQPANIRVMRGLKANYAAGVTAERLEWIDGLFVPVEMETPRSQKRAALSDIELTDLRYRLLIGLKRTLQNGGTVPADELDARSMPSRARRNGSAEINRVPLNELYRAQNAMLEAGQIVRVGVGKKCLIRPHDGPYYQNEEPWLTAVAPPRERDAAD
jgi:hypothetical protein